VLDEPNSNLDTEGDRALTSAIQGVRDRGGIVAVISHRPNLLEALDFVLIMHEGKCVAFGPRDYVMSKFNPTVLPAAKLEKIKAEQANKKLPGSSIEPPSIPGTSKPAPRRTQEQPNREDKEFGT
jgi:ABC-type protease/lipase transport system fused ATPase/permease subunit